MRDWGQENWCENACHKALDFTEWVCAYTYAAVSDQMQQVGLEKVTHKGEGLCCEYMNVSYRVQAALKA